MFTNRKDHHAVMNDESCAMLSENESTGARSYGSAEDASASEDAEDLISTSSPQQQSPSLTTSLVGPVANLCSATLGAGVLALPYALQQAGLVWGAILLLLAASSTLYSLQLLVEACRVFDTYTYEGIVQLALGKRARTITEVSILLFCGGCAVAYIITVGDIVESLSFNRNVAMLVVWCIAMLPLSLLKTMTSLQSASGVGIFSIFWLIVVANIHYLQDKHHHTAQSSMSWSTLLWPAHGMTAVLTACPLIIFAFSCQPNVCAIYHELHDKRKMQRVLNVAVSVCALLYTSISLAAYLDFGKTVQPNVLQNYCISHALIQMAFVGMSIAVVMAFPLNIFPTRVTLEGLIWGEHRHASEVEMEDTSSAGMSSVEEPLLAESYHENDDSILPNVSTSRHVGLTLGITTLALALAMVAPNISVVFGLLGGTASSIIGFILPGMVGMKVLHANQHWKAKLLVVGGIVIGILTTAVTVYSTFVPSSSGTAPHNPCNVTS